MPEDQAQDVAGWKAKAKKFFKIGNRGGADTREDTPEKRLEAARRADYASRVGPLVRLLQTVPHANPTTINALRDLDDKARVLHDDGNDAEAIAKLEEIFAGAKEIAEAAEGAAKEIYKRERDLTDKAIKKVHKKRETRKAADTPAIVDAWWAAEKTAKSLLIDDQGVKVRDYVGAAEEMKACRALMNDLLPPEERVDLPEQEDQEEGLDPNALVEGLEGFAPPLPERADMVIAEALSIIAPPGDATSPWSDKLTIVPNQEQSELRGSLERQMQALQDEQRALQTQIAELPEARQVFALVQALNELDSDEDPLEFGVKLRELEEAIVALQTAIRAKLMEPMEEDAEAITAAFENLTEQDRFDTFMDARAFDPTGDDGKISPELRAAREALDRVAKCAKAMKANGAPYEELAALWERVPEEFRPDEVIEELRPYSMARKAIAGESEASRQQSREHAKGGLQSLALVVGGVVDGILTSTLDASVVEGLAEGVSPFDGGSGDQQADDEWFDAEGGKLHGWAVSASLLQAGITATAIGLERRARAIAIADDVAERNNPETLLELQRARSGRLKMAEHIKIGRKLTSNVITTLKLFAAHPMLAGFLTMVKGILKLLQALEFNLKRLEAAEKELLLLMTQEETGRTEPVNESATVMRKALTQQKQLAERKQKAATIGAAGQITRGVGTMVAGSGEAVSGAVGLGVMAVGGTMEGVGVALTARAEFANYKINKAEEKKCIALLQDAAAGDAEAKKAIMKESSFYAAMYLALAAKEGDSTAVKVLNDMQLTAEDIEKHSAYLLRKAMLWASGKDDRSPDEAGMVGIAKGGVKSAGAKVLATFESAGDAMRRRNQTDDRVVVREFVAEFTSQNWEETKKAAYDSGVKEKKTGIAKQFEAMEKAEAKINAKNPKERLKAVQACEEIFKLLGGLTPEWISPRSDNAAPEGFITYIQDMRNLASEKRLELLGAIPEDELKTRPYFLADIAATPKSFSDNCEIAKRYGVVMDDAVKAASKAFEEFQKLRQKMPDDLEEFDGDEFDAKLALQMIETSRDLSIAVAACAPVNKLTGDVDQSFRAYADMLSTHILQHITEPLESFADGKRAQFSPPAHRDDSPKLSRHRVKEAYETARNECLLEEEMPESMTAALDKLSAALKREELNLADDELDGSAKLIKAFDEIAVDLLEFEKEARSWRKQIRDHKPFRDYLLELAESARAKAKEADAKKAICVAARDGAEKVDDAPKRPTLSLGDWTRWVTVARAQPGKIDRGNAAGTTQAFKNYEKAPLLPPADELLEDVKHARKIFKKRRHALYSLDALLPKVMKVDDPELGSAIKSWLEAVRLDYADIDYAEGVVDGFEMEAKRERDEEKAARKAARRK